MASNRVSSNWSMSRNRYYGKEEISSWGCRRSEKGCGILPYMVAAQLTVKGVPNRDSLPKVSSGKDTPISEMAVCTDDIPGYSNSEWRGRGGWKG